MLIAVSENINNDNMIKCTFIRPFLVLKVGLGQIFAWASNNVSCDLIIK